VIKDVCLSADSCGTLTNLILKFSNIVQQISTKPYTNPEDSGADYFSVQTKTVQGYVISFGKA